MVLRGRQGHRLHRRRRAAGAPQGREPRLPDPLPAEPRVEGLQPGHARLPAAPLRAPAAGGQPALHRQLEQQAGPRLPVGRQPVDLRLALPLAAARGPGASRHQGIEQDDPRRADRRDGRCRHRRPARLARAALDAEGDRQAEGPRARRRGGQARRLARPRRPPRGRGWRPRVRGRRRDRAHGCVVAALGAGPLRAPAREAALGGVPPPHRLRDRQRPELRRRTPRLVLAGLDLLATSRRTCAPCSARR